MNRSSENNTAHWHKSSNGKEQSVTPSEAQSSPELKDMMNDPAATTEDQEAFEISRL
eukprot:CAMPEP_0176398268 /NCGR_PEP_ID=MMETSP0126-20121128/45801_1 /TAXON_ID=141414 ORGANISM="Strombidinopsis acuminatum, Strain SPMC142" /NCGR_SAMPLE_ID=MMETSP0126 /ASSEMBLY_ACC=CAM_ASM_000229 /LENGTH=56 /DNA_ID=CAMNT_0017773101 /DNA_START=179 /DNA_END=352 /DNA_ORIENTATION=+